MKLTTKLAIIELMSGSLDRYVESSKEGECILERPIDITERTGISGLKLGGMTAVDEKKRAILSCFEEMKISTQDKDGSSYVSDRSPDKSAKADQSAEFYKPENSKIVSVNLKIFDGLSEAQMDSLRDWVIKKESKYSNSLATDKNEHKRQRGGIMRSILAPQLQKCRKILEDIGPKKSVEPPSKDHEEKTAPRRSM